VHHEGRLAGTHERTEGARCGIDFDIPAGIAFSVGHLSMPMGPSGRPAKNC
jgi:hypothetical protein